MATWDEARQRRDLVLENRFTEQEAKLFFVTFDDSSAHYLINYKYV
jgi:hypothetical protein